jgi:hypothetical protein
MSYKKDKFLTKRYIILLLFTIRNLSFLYFPKYNVFFNGTFFYMHPSRKYLPIYFNAIIFEDIKV